MCIINWNKIERVVVSYLHKTKGEFGNTYIDWFMENCDIDIKNLQWLNESISLTYPRKKPDLKNALLKPMCPLTEWKLVWLILS